VKTERPVLTRDPPVLEQTGDGVGKAFIRPHDTGQPQQRRMVAWRRNDAVNLGDDFAGDCEEFGKFSRKRRENMLQSLPTPIR
jgi:hypothetical protein